MNEGTANGDGDAEEFPESDLHQQWADLQFVPPSCDDRTSRALFLKQVASVGARDWTNCEKGSLRDLLAGGSADGSELATLITSRVAALRSTGIHLSVALKVAAHVFHAPCQGCGVARKSKSAAAVARSMSYVAWAEVEVEVE